MSEHNYLNKKKNSKRAEKRRKANDKRKKNRFGGIVEPMYDQVD